MLDYVAEPLKPVFDYNGLFGFSDFWNRKIEWFEAPNHRRGGWSGVARSELTLPDGGRLPVFVKRQANHMTRTWRHPFRGQPTLIREFENRK